MGTTSRISGFYRLSLRERRKAIGEVADLSQSELAHGLDAGGLQPDHADNIVENVLGTYALPFGVQLNVRLNGYDRLIPMVVEEPSVIAAASNAARIVRGAGGFTARVEEALMTAQIQVTEVPDFPQAERNLTAAADELLGLAAAAVPRLVARGGGPRSLQVRDLGDGMLVVHVHVDCGDAMGANLVNTIAEALGPQVSNLSGGRLGLRILTNLCDRRLVHAVCEAEVDHLVGAGQTSDGRRIAEDIVRASQFAEKDPYRAATHNKGIMNGVDSVVIATGNDYRAVEAGAHAYAAQGGRYKPLATWRLVADRLRGTLTMPLSLGIVGGTLRVHPTAQLALKLARVRSAADLSMLAACAGLASNLAALRALATEGIQRGHMSLHARSVAVAAGARCDEVNQLASMLAERGTIDRAAAERLLAELRNAESP